MNWRPELCQRQSDHSSGFHAPVAGDLCEKSALPYHCTALQRSDGKVHHSTVWRYLFAATKNIDIQKWIFSLQKASPRTGKPLSPKNDQKHYVESLGGNEKAVMLELIPKNPCDDLTLPKLEHYQPEVYSMEEVETLLQCARNTALYLPLMIEICLGLRRGELLALRWHHVDFQTGCLTVEENLVTVNNQTITKAPKTQSGRREIQIPGTLLRLLKDTKAERHAGQNDYIVCQEDGSPYKSDSFSMKFRRFLKANDLKHIRFHDLRHINATIMLSLGISPKVAQERLGHSSYQITMDIYSHVLKKSSRKPPTSWMLLCLNRTPA